MFVLRELLNRLIFAEKVKRVMTVETLIGRLLQTSETPS